MLVRDERKLIEAFNNNTEVKRSLVDDYNEKEEEERVDVSEFSMTKRSEVLIKVNEKSVCDSITDEFMPRKEKVIDDDYTREMAFAIDKMKRNINIAHSVRMIMIMIIVYINYYLGIFWRILSWI